MTEGVGRVGGRIAGGSQRGSEIGTGKRPGWLWVAAPAAPGCTRRTRGQPATRGTRAPLGHLGRSPGFARPHALDGTELVADNTRTNKSARVQNHPRPAGRPHKSSRAAPPRPACACACTRAAAPPSAPAAAPDPDSAPRSTATAPVCRPPPRQRPPSASAAETVCAAPTPTPTPTLTRPTGPRPRSHRPAVPRPRPLPSTMAPARAKKEPNSPTPPSDDASPKDGSESGKTKRKSVSLSPSFPRPLHPARGPLSTPHPPPSRPRSCPAPARTSPPRPRPPRPPSASMSYPFSPRSVHRADSPLSFPAQAAITECVSARPFWPSFLPFQTRG